MDSGRLIRIIAKRRWLLLILVFTAMAAWRVSQIEGLLSPIRVAGPSMSPTFWGPHQRVSCEACGFVYRVHAPTTRTLRCFGCGQLGLHVSETTRAGDRVLIDRAAYLFSAPHREDLIAIRMPSGGLQVKRVVGLPGEVLRIDPKGQLVVDDQPLRISPEQSWERSIVVYDDRYPGSAGSRWRTLASGDWLLYEHLDVHNPGGSGDAEVRIRDDNPANASLSRQTHPVEDLQLEVRVQSTEACRLEVVFASDPQPIFAAIELAAGERTVRLSKIDDAIWHLPAEGPPRRIAAAGESRGSELGRGEVAPPEVDFSRPVAIRLRGRGPGAGNPGAGSEPRVAGLWLGRSLRFDPPRAYAERWLRGIPVAAGRYLVIGDNPPASEDSRSAPEGIAAERIVGRVHRWPF